MAYSMLERPKLYKAKSMKVYEEYQHTGIPPRHKHGARNLHNSSTKCCHKHCEIDDQTSSSIKSKYSHDKKCPIYIHNYMKIKNDNNDYNEPSKKNTKKMALPINKIEESYWASWKPNKNNSYYGRHTKRKDTNISKIESNDFIIDGDAVFYNKGESSSNTSNPKINIIQETQSKHSCLEITKSIHKQKSTDNDSISKVDHDEVAHDKVDHDEVEEEPADEVKLIKHTDSFILNSKKHQQEERKERFEQPKCIRLYKKPGYNQSNNYIKGGSYPLKSCLKMESTFGRGNNVRLGRPGSSLVVSNIYNKYPRSFRR